MDKQLEQKIRERAYELWMQNGSLPGRAEEYWFQAEQEVMGEAGNRTAGGVEGGPPSDFGSSSGAEGGEQTAEGERQETLDVSPAPLGMTSETADEAQAAPAAPKTRKRRSSAAAAPAESGEATGATPKRRRSPRTS